MPSKLQFYSEFAERTARQITGSYQSWTAFLATAARLYKYPYNRDYGTFLTWQTPRRAMPHATLRYGKCVPNMKRKSAPC